MQTIKRLGCLVVLISLLSCGGGKAVASIPDSLSYYSDAAYLVETVEDTHPFFVLEPEKLDDYEAVKNRYLEAIHEDMSINSFCIETQKYLASFGDAHMGAGLKALTMYLEIDWIAIDGELYLVENGIISNETVLEIEGIAIENVMECVEQCYAAENDSALQNNYTLHCRQKEMIELAANKVYGTMPVQVRLLTSKGRVIPCSFQLHDIRALRSSVLDGNPYHVEMLGDVLYIDVRRMDEGYALDAAVATIKEHVQAGVSKAIIDVTNCPGGMANVCHSIINALNMIMPSYSCYIRSSTLLWESKWFVKTTDERVDQPFYSVKNDQIQLLVLTNVNTFSAAMLLPVCVQDGGLGLIVGQPPRNAPTSYGSRLDIILPYSKLPIGVSFVKWYRPDKNADQDTLIPDISIPLFEDILTSALGLFN